MPTKGTIQRAEATSAIQTYEYTGEFPPAYSKHVSMARWRAMIIHEALQWGEDELVSVIKAKLGA